MIMTNMWTLIFLNWYPFKTKICLRFKLAQKTDTI